MMVCSGRFVLDIDDNLRYYSIKIKKEESKRSNAIGEKFVKAAPI